MFTMPQKRMGMHVKLSAMSTNSVEYACCPYNLLVWTDGRSVSGIAVNVSESAFVW